MTVSTFTQPDYSSQSGSSYKAALDGAAHVHNRIAGPFAPHAASTPDMKVYLDAGFIPAAGALPAEVAAQDTGALTAPSSNPRKDIVYIDRETGVVGVAAGTEDPSPSDPAVPSGKIAVARINWTAGMTEITNADLDDLRTLSMLGLGTMALTDVVAAPDIVLPSGRIVGRATAGAGTAEELTLTQVLDLVGAATQGDILVRGESAWQRLASGPAGEFLTVLGAGILGWSKPGGGITAGTAQATTSGSTVTFGSIPAGTKQITVSLAGVSLNAATSTIAVQIGDAGGLEATGYLGSVLLFETNAGAVTTVDGAFHSTSALIAEGSGSPGAGAGWHGTCVWSLVDASTYTWTWSSIIACDGASSGYPIAWYGAGTKSLSAELTQISVLTSGTFDAGKVNILYQ